MKNTLYIFSIVLISFFGLSKSAYSSHYAAADLTYTCLGGNLYQITLTFFRDCSGIDAPLNATINITSSCGNQSVTLPLLPGYPIDVTPVCPSQNTCCSYPYPAPAGCLYGLEKFVYQGNVTLTPCANWSFVWTGCCRNPSNTLLNATSQDWYLPATLNNAAAPCNNSPYFSNMPATVICMGQNFCYNHGALDPDGDSLVYSLVSPFQAAGNPVTYQGGYNALNPLPSSPPINIDPVTGDICMNATQTIIAVVGVRVEEWRRINGVATLIGAILRDMQVNVIACNNLLPVLPGLNPLATAYNPNDTIYYHEMCLGETVYFNLYPFDGNVPLQNLTLTWNNGIPAAFWLVSNNGTPNAWGQFIWYPGPADVSNVPHCFTVNVADDNCPYIGQQTFSYCILVKTNEVTLDPPNDTTLCPGQSYILTGHNTSDVVNLNWFVDSLYTIPAINDTTFLVHADSLGPGIHTIAVYDGAINNCPGSNYVTVTVLPSSFITATALPPDICVGQSSVLTATGGSSYNWLPGNIPDSSITVSPATTSTYTVTGSAFNACTASATVTVNVNTTIPVTATTSPPVICLGENSTLNASGGTTYNWMPGNLSGSSITVSPLTSTNYSVTGNNDGCTGTATVLVTVNPVPLISALASPPAICSGFSSTLSANSTVPGTNFSWMPGGLVGPSVSVSPLSFTTYTLTGEAAACLDTTTVTVTVNPNPSVTASVMPSGICAGEMISLTANSNIPATTFSWMPGNMIGDSMQITPPYTTTYTVTGTDANGCVGMANTTIFVTPFPTITTSAYPWILCEGDTSRITASGAANYNWNPGDFPGDTLMVTPSVTTIYSVTADVNGCSGSATVMVSVYPNPIVTFDADLYQGCEDLPVQFTDLSNFPAASWYWDFGDNMYSYDQNPKHIFPNPGLYDVKLKLTSTFGCTSSHTWPEMISVYKLPHAYFTPVPEQVEELNPTVWFADQSYYASTWNWYFGDPSNADSTSHLQNPSHTFSDTGNYLVTLVVFTEHQCTDTFRYAIDVNPSVVFYVPNAFSPNSDGKNETFRGQGIGIDNNKFQMLIFNRWGEEIFATNDQYEAWEGTHGQKGKMCQEGVYTWLVKFTDILGKDHKLKGFVTLIQ